MVDNKTKDKTKVSKIVDRDFQLELPDESTGGCSILMVGSTRCGKTTALKHIIDRYFKKHIGIIFSESAKAPAYKDMKYNNFPLSSVFDSELIRDCYIINKETKNYYPFLFVLDDCPLVKNDKQLLKMLTIYRNSAISGIVCVQSPTLLNPTSRSNFNFVFLFKQNTSAQAEAVIKSFLRGVFPEGLNYDQKIDLYNKLTADHHFIFIDNLAGTISRCKIDLS
jgi:hypothetical protein